MVMSFDIKMIMKSGAIKIVFKSWEPFMTYQLINTAIRPSGLDCTVQKNPKLYGIFIYEWPLVHSNKGEKLCTNLHIYNAKTTHNTMQCKCR